MKRLHMAVVMRIIFGLSIILVCIQIILLMCSCKCTMVESQVEKRSDNMNILTLIQEYKEKIQSLSKKIKKLEIELGKFKRLDKYLVSEELYQNKQSLNDLTFLNSYTPRTEFEVIPFDAFTSQHLFGEIGFLSKRPSATPIGQQAVELAETLEFAMKVINQDIESRADRIGIDNFAEGIMRNDRTHGTIYDMYFRSSKMPEIFKRLKLIRPYSNIQIIGKPETVDTSNEWINLILPLSNRLDKFKIFMERFIDVGIRTDRRIFLTIVYFGDEGRTTIKETILNISKRESFEDYKVIFSEGEFSRGRGLQQGVESWKKGNVLMFFCDVDIYFDTDFLERCRLHTSPGLKVYYPIVFSQYNPDIIFGGQKPPPLKDQMYISYDAGFWRDFGFGMTCQYRDDFFNVGGFDLTIRGWGGEDIALYKQHLRNRMTIIRAYDRSILHIYHSKNCRKTLSDAQFISCLQSKAVAEGSHKQLGMLAFGANLVTGTDPDWGKRLKASLSDMNKDKKEK